MLQQVKVTSFEAISLNLQPIWRADSSTAKNNIKSPYLECYWSALLYTWGVDRGHWSGEKEIVVGGMAGWVAR